MTNSYVVDCRTDEGVTVGLLDAVITLARVLRGRPIGTEAERAALADLREDEDVRALVLADGAA
ncbi:MAG TPA: hypothetical protein VGL21_07785 [Jatrophihabitantaceae bacterium]